MLGRLDRFKDWGPVILRVVMGITFAAHGYGKVFGGMEKFKEIVVGLGMPPFLAYVSAGTEFFGGLLLIVGLLTRWTALFITINMAVAILTVHLKHGLIGEGGFEYPLMLLTASLVLMLWGGGPLSLDRDVLKREF